MSKYADQYFNLTVIQCRNLGEIVSASPAQGFNLANVMILSNSFFFCRYLLYRIDLTTKYKRILRVITFVYVFVVFIKLLPC